MNNVPLTKVAKILGHKELTTTQRYAHLGEASLVDAMDGIQYGIPREQNVKRPDGQKVGSA